MVGRHKGTLLWLALPATVFLGAFFVLPLVFVVADSLSDGGSAYGRVTSRSGLLGRFARQSGDWFGRTDVFIGNWLFRFVASVAKV